MMFVIFLCEEDLSKQRTHIQQNIAQYMQRRHVSKDVHIHNITKSFIHNDAVLFRCSLELLRDVLLLYSYSSSICYVVVWCFLNVLVDLSCQQRAHLYIFLFPLFCYFTKVKKRLFLAVLNAKQLSYTRSIWQITCLNVNLLESL